MADTSGVRTLRVKDEGINIRLLLSMGREGNSPLVLELDKMNLLGEPVQTRIIKLKFRSRQHLS